MYKDEKRTFAVSLRQFAASMERRVTRDGEWTMKGFIDVFRNVYALSTDTKLISKVLEMHLFPFFLDFARKNGYSLEPASYQNWYPDLSFVRKDKPEIKFAVDLKTTYRDDKYPDFCNGFTLGSHGEYFINRDSKKNIQYPYSQYAGHFCLGMIYSRSLPDPAGEPCVYQVNDVESIPSAIRNFTFFAEEKWRIASDKSGSGNTANIGSIRKIDDILTGSGVFSLAGEELFDDYWMNYGTLQIPDGQGRHKKLSSLSDYLAYRGLPADLYYPAAKKSGRETVPSAGGKDGM